MVRENLWDSSARLVRPSPTRKPSFHSQNPHEWRTHEPCVPTGQVKTPHDVCLSSWHYSLLITNCFSSRTDYSLLTPNYSLKIMPLISFGTLAMRYYPDKTYRTATRLFRHELEVTKGLLRALKKAGYTPTSRLLTRTQVRIIEKFIGEAG